MDVSRDAKLCPIILLAKSTGDYKLYWEHVFGIISQGTLTLFIYRIVQAHEELIWEAQFTPTLSLPTKSQGTEPSFAPPQQKKLPLLTVSQERKGNGSLEMLWE